LRFADHAVIHDEIQESVMNSQVMSWTEWVLIPVAVLLLALLHRLDLLAVIVPVSVLAGYAASERCLRRNSSRRM